MTSLLYRIWRCIVFYLPTGRTYNNISKYNTILLRITLLLCYVQGKTSNKLNYGTYVVNQSCATGRVHKIMYIVIKYK